MSEQQKEEKKYMVDVRIPPECMEDEGNCEHSPKKDKRQHNPV